MSILSNQDFIKINLCNGKFKFFVNFITDFVKLYAHIYKFISTGFMIYGIAPIRNTKERPTAKRSVFIYYGLTTIFTILPGT